jgi:Holliday junction resolvase RusA-like endonuclease|tara:strand:+ start:580 stop:1023 length:444 start_codon:yes stop_codon:yes gene_type:complete
MSDWDIELVIPGSPIGKGRPRGTAAGGFVRLYTPKKTADWERSAALIARNAWCRAPLDSCPIEVEIVAVFHRPKRLLRKKDPECRVVHTSKPDIDNVIKSALDMSVMAGLMRDDSLVCKISASSYYSSKSEGPSLEFRMRVLDVTKQ